MLKSKWTIVVERHRRLPQIPKSEIAVRNPSFDVVVYEEPSPVQPIIYDTKEPKRERRASVALESPYHVESDGYLLVTACGILLPAIVGEVELMSHQLPDGSNIVASHKRLHVPKTSRSRRMREGNGGNAPPAERVGPPLRCGLAETLEYAQSSDRPH